MTDLATIRIPVDSSDMVQAVRESKNLERGIKMLVEALDSGAIGANQYNAGLRQLQKEFKSLFDNYQQATRRIRDFARDVLDSKEAAEKAAKAKSDLALATKKAETAFALANQRAKEELQTLKARSDFAFSIGQQRAKEAAAQEAEIERLRLKYDRLYSSSRLYDQILEEINRAHSLGAVSTSLQTSEIERLNKEYQDFQNGTAGPNNRFIQDLKRNTEGINDFGVGIQQIGYQVGDFLVQIQSGTDAFVAFGQQATQLVGFLPSLAESLGIASTKLNVIATVLGIAIPLVTAFGAYFNRTSQEVEDKAKDQEDAIKSLDNTLREYLRTREAALLGVTPGQKSAQDELEEARQAAIEAGKALQDVTEMSSNAASASLGYTILLMMKSGEATAALEAQAQAQQRVMTLRDMMLESYSKEAQELRNNSELELIRLRYGEYSLQYLKASEEQERRRYESGLQSLGVSEGYVQALMYQYDLTVKARKQEEAQKTLRELSKKTVEGLQGVMYDISQMDLSGPFWKMFDAIKASVQEAKKLPMSTGNMDWAKNQLGFILPGAELLPPEPVGTSGGGGGGGGGRSATQTTTLENKLEEVYRYLELDKYLLEQETIAYEQRQDVLRSALENKLITLQEYNELEKAIATQHQQDLLNIEQQAKSVRLQEMSGLFGALASVAEVGGKKMLRVQATFSAAATLIAAYETAQKAAAEAVTIPGRIAAYAKFLAMGLKAVSAIRSAGGIGGGTGGVGGASGGRGSATVAPTAAAPTPQTVFIDSIDPKNLYSGETLINLFEALYDENDRRGKVFVVAR